MSLRGRELQFKASSDAPPSASSGTPPLALRAYGAFLVGLFLCEIVLLVWQRPAVSELPSLRYTLEMGYLTSMPLVVAALRGRKLLSGWYLVAILGVQVAYTTALYLVSREPPETWILWTLSTSLIWMLLLATPPVRRFCSADRRMLD